LGATGFFKFNLINADAANYQFLFSKKRPHVKKKDPRFNGIASFTSFAVILEGRLTGYEDFFRKRRR
jgi:hypothetical protein